jgi:tRNA G18 (ribose-2'-O)-methylase SpoU
VPIEPVVDALDPRLSDYRNVPDPELLHRHNVFIAEGRLVVRRLIEQRRLEVRSLLLTPPAFDGLQDVLSQLEASTPIFLAPQALMDGVVGFNIHRGCLAAGVRPAPPRLDDLLAPPGEDSLIVVLEGVGNADNVGAVFRNAAAFGASAVLLAPGCCDPLYRKAIRVSVAGTLQVPFAWLEPWPVGLLRLRDAGFALIALTPDRTAEQFVDTERRGHGPRRIALLLGSEGEGLTPQVQQMADRRVRIPIAPGVDSLNVATAAGIALHRLSGWSEGSQPSD